MSKLTRMKTLQNGTNKRQMRTEEAKCTIPQKQPRCCQGGTKIIKSGTDYLNRTFNLKKVLEEHIQSRRQTEEAFEIQNKAGKLFSKGNR